MRNIGILVFDGFDLMDVAGPYEVFLTASRLSERDGGEPLYGITMIAPEGADVAAYGGLGVTGLVSASDADAVDVLVVPGIIDLAAGRADTVLAGAVSSLAEGATLVTSVCTGAFFLADAGLLAGKGATTHWEDVPDLAALASVGEAVPGVRWVDAEDVVTSGGLISGMHMALHVVARQHGEELASRTARQIDLDWSPLPER